MNLFIKIFYPQICFLCISYYICVIAIHLRFYEKNPYPEITHNLLRQKYIYDTNFTAIITLSPKR